MKPLSFFLKFPDRSLPPFFYLPTRQSSANCRCRWIPTVVWPYAASRVPPTAHSSSLDSLHPSLAPLPLSTRSYHPPPLISKSGELPAAGTASPSHLDAHASHLERRCALHRLCLAGFGCATPSRRRLCSPPCQHSWRGRCCCQFPFLLCPT